MRPDNDKRWQTALTCVAGGFAGAWLGYTLYEAWDWLVARPELYAAYSAPWYTGPLLLAGPAALIVAAALAAKWWLRRKRKRAGPGLAVPPARRPAPARGFRGGAGG